ncbi:MAG: hypothetical protein RPU13_16935 [Candidatus Sedimenticola sp. (ex Thyasira tokunagai)]
MSDTGAETVTDNDIDVDRQPYVRLGLLTLFFTFAASHGERSEGW